jgi:hypothetical protein
LVDSLTDQTVVALILALFLVVHPGPPPDLGY